MPDPDDQAPASAEPQAGTPQGRDGLAVSPRDAVTGRVEAGKGPGDRPGTEAEAARRAPEDRKD